jgi:S-formylglutathione hydrolase FrmB
MRRLVLLATAGAAAAVFLCAPGSASSGQRDDTSFVSAGIGGRLHFEAYLPPGYANGTKRYPVVYVLHGLPASATAYTTLRFVERAVDAAGRPAIVVIPQAARAGESDPEYVDRGAGDAWGTAIATELPRVVDARFRTIRSRAGRALVGISAGGYGAMHLALRHLDEFSVVESWSGYFHPTDPTGTQSLDLGSAARNLQADVHRLIPTVRARLRSLPTFIAFYVGRSDWRFYAENETLNQELSEAGIVHVFRAYPGGHDQQLWQRYAAAWLELALVHLEPAH